MSGVYISYPFCPHKCTFCNFASGVFPPAVQRDYTGALLAEIGRHQWRWTPDTLYLGGGTPSTMDVGDLQRVLRAIPGAPWREATIEALPGTLTRDRITAWRSLGINRVSLGVQSFVSGEVRHTGRKHDAATVARDCDLLRACGIGNISVDLIAGLPRQTLESWRISLDWIARIDVPHVSVYLLAVDEDSRLGLEVLQGGSHYGARMLPDDSLAADMYELAVDSLAGLGLERYEISNFGRPGFESLHNMKYWTLEPYIGFGTDAHSFDNGVRWANSDTVGQTSVDVSNSAPEEKFFIGLRLLRGIQPSAEEWRKFDTPISRFIADGLLERAGDTLRLTPRGVLLSNEVFQEFLP